LTPEVINLTRTCPFEGSGRSVSTTLRTSFAGPNVEYKPASILIPFNNIDVKPLFEDILIEEAQLQKIRLCQDIHENEGFPIEFFTFDGKIGVKDINFD